MNKHEKWNVNFGRYNKAKYKVLHLGGGHPWHQYNLGNEGIEDTSTVKDLEVWMDVELDMI